MVVDLLDCTPQEREWLEGCRKANPKAQEKVFKRYYGLVYGICIRYLSSKELAQEVIDDCFLKLFHQLESVCRYPDYFRRWLRQLAVHTAIDAYRKEKQKQYLTTGSLDDQLLEVGDQETVHDTLNAEQILELLAQLPDLWRLTFNLYEIEGYSHEEISQLLNIPVSSSRVYLTRAKQRLRELLGQRDSVRTYMPIYYVPSVGRPQDPDWGHFRETLHAFEPIGDADAWHRFQQFQRRSQCTQRWQTGRLIILVMVTLVSKQSQSADPFWNTLQPTMSKPTRIVAVRIPKAQSIDVFPLTVATHESIPHTDQSIWAVHNQRKLELNTGSLRTSDFPSLSNQALFNNFEKPAQVNAFYKSELVNKPAFKLNGSLPERLTGRLPQKAVVSTGTIIIDNVEVNGFRKVHKTTSSKPRAVMTQPSSASPSTFHLADQFSKTRAPYRYYRTNRVAVQANLRNRTNSTILTNKQSVFRPTSISANHTPTELSTPNGSLKLTLNKLMTRPFSFSRLQPRLAAEVKALVISLPMSQPVRKQVNLGLMLGSQVVSAPSGNPSLGVTGGIWTDLQLSRKLSIETGLMIAHSQITQPGNGLVRQDSINRWELLQQTYQWWTASLPLTVRYTILDTRRLKWWAALGVSSAATFSEKQLNDYRVSSLSANPADSSQHPNSYTKQVAESPSARVLFQPFRWITVSSGVRVMASGKHEWWLEPYYSYPIGGLTASSLRVSQAGIRMKLRFLRFH